LRRAQPRPKERCRVLIPAELRNSLREVAELIQQAMHDPEIVLDCDDAIQVGAVCGGRVGESSRPYVLTYFPAGDAERGRWFLTLHGTEIEDIADGRMTEIAMHCCTTPECHSKFREGDDHCFYCDYVPDPEYAHLSIGAAMSRLKGMGITRLTTSTTRDDVLAELGQPQESGGDVQDQAMMNIMPWIKYHRPDCQLRFEFGRDGVIEAVTFMPAGWRPGQ
jgi:hypothetical protein